MKNYTLVLFALLFISLYSLSGTFFLEEKDVNNDLLATQTVDETEKNRGQLSKQNKTRPKKQTAAHKLKITDNAAIEKEQLSPE